MKNDCGQRVYVDHLLAEHRRLDHLISRTVATLPSWEDTDAATWLPGMIAGLTAIRDELAHHFQEEEAGGCLEEAVAYCPGLSSEVTDIEADHVKLLADVDELIQRARQLTAPTARDAHVLGQELQVVVQELRVHEVQENRIMQRGFGLNLEGDDA